MINSSLSNFGRETVTTYVMHADSLSSNGYLNSKPTTLQGPPFTD